MAGWRVIVVLLAAVAAEDVSRTVTITCPDGYGLVGTNCYFVTAHSLTGSTAEKYCNMTGGHAAVIESQEEMDLLKETVLNTTVYLGVNLLQYRKYQFQFALKMAGHTGFTAFGAGEPEGYDSADCVIADGSDGFNWKDVDCVELHPVLCKVAGVVGQVKPRCSEGEHFFNGTCFWVSSDVRNYSWSEGQDQCRARGMELASLHSQEEHDFLWRLAHGRHATWIGLIDRAGDGVYEWSDGTPLDYDGWVRGDPWHDMPYYCVVMVQGSFYGGWMKWKGTIRERVACRGPAI